MYKRVIWWAIMEGVAWLGYWFGRELERQRQVAQLERVEKLTRGAGGVING